MSTNLIEVQNLSFAYAQAGREIAILESVSFSVKPGEFVAVQGPSGSGKSTLFYILGGLLRPTSGRIHFAGKDLTQMADLELATFRNRQIGFVFQQFHLLARATVLDNLLVPTFYPSELGSAGAGRERAVTLAKRFGLSEYLGQKPNQLSGGQQQRVAIARALMHDTQLILADEPTGNLDSRNAELVMETLLELNREGRTIILITHDPEIARRSGRVLTVRDGRVIASETSKTSSAEAARPTEGAMVEPFQHLRGSTARILANVLPMALANLWRNKAKSILTMLGVVIGVAAVLAMITTGEFTKAKILEGYEALGVNKLEISGYPSRDSGKKNKAKAMLSGLQFSAFDVKRDLENLPAIFPQIQRLSPVLPVWNAGVTHGGRSWTENVRAFGVGEDYLPIVNHQIATGRTFSTFHVERRNPVCIVGSEIPARLALQDPIGTIVTIGVGEEASFPCKIIGTLKAQTSNQSWYKPNYLVLIPHTYLSTAMTWNSEIRNIAVKLHEDSKVEETGKQIKGFFEQKYGDSARFHVDSDSTLVENMKRFLTIFSLLLGGIALLSLVVGGIGIHNMMLVSVAERLKEIGLRKALGATSRSVRMQILCESVALCVTAGMIGLTLGLGTCGLMMYGATKFMPTLTFQWVINPWAIGVSCLAIVVVGIASGLTPAIRAEKLEVIEALRSE